MVLGLFYRILIPKTMPEKQYLLLNKEEMLLFYWSRWKQQEPSWPFTSAVSQWNTI